MSYYSVTFVNQENEQQYSDTLTPSPPPHPTTKHTRRMADHAFNNFKLEKVMGVYVML